MFPSIESILVLLVTAALVLIALFLVYTYITAKPYPVLTRHDSEKFYFDPGSKSKRKFPDYSEPATIDLSVIVPAYNEEERLPVMMSETMQFLQARQSREPGFLYEVIIVDDGSMDATTMVGLKQADQYGADKVRVLTLQKNRGKGGAVRLGVLSSRGHSILFVDADGASRFSDLDKLERNMAQQLSKAKTSAEDRKLKNLESMAVVCGSRAHLEEKAIASRSLFRTVLMKGFHLVVWTMCVRGVRDTQCGFKLLTRSAALLLFLNLHVERWAFDVDMLYLAQHFGIPTGEVAIEWQEIEGTKMVPVWSWLQMGRDILLIRLRYSLGVWKVKSKF